MKSIKKKKIAYCELLRQNALHTTHTHAVLKWYFQMKLLKKKKKKRRINIMLRILLYTFGISFMTCLDKLSR